MMRREMLAVVVVGLMAVFVFAIGRTVFGGGDDSVEAVASPAAIEEVQATPLEAESACRETWSEIERSARSEGKSWGVLGSTAAIAEDGGVSRSADIANCEWEEWGDTCGFAEPAVLEVTDRSCTVVPGAECIVREANRHLIVDMTIPATEVQRCKDSGCSCVVAWKNHARLYQVYPR